MRNAATTDKAHGRFETRRASTSAEVVPYLGWPGAAQVLRVERTREIKGQTSTSVAYYVTSLSADEAGPDRLLALTRSHWAIENKLHWRRDVSMNEDRCRVRAGARPLASLRNTVLSLLKSCGTSVPAARETYAANPSQALSAVTGRIL